MFKKSIKKQVMKVIANKIAEAQKAHDDEIRITKSEISSKKIELLNKFEEEVKKLKIDSKAQLDSITEKHVNSILNKII